MQALLDPLSIAVNLLVLGAHASVPWRLADENAAARRTWALSSLPFLLLAMVLTLLRFSSQEDRLIGAGFESPLWRAPPALTLALLCVILLLADGVLLTAWSQLEDTGWRLASGVGLLALVGFSYFAEAALPSSGGPLLLLLRACLRSGVAFAVGAVLLPVAPGRSPALAGGTLAVLVYLALLPRDVLVAAWAGGDLLFALVGAVLIASPRWLLGGRSPQGAPRASRSTRVLLLLAAVALAAFFTRLDAVPSEPLVSSFSLRGTS